MLPNFKALVAFEALIRQGSMMAAARELGVSQAAVSQQLKRLESFLGQPLFERDSRGLVPTQAAQQYQPVVAGCLGHLRHQTQALFGDDKPQILTLRVNHTLAHCWLLPRLPDFFHRHPFIRLDISVVDWPSRDPCRDVDIEITNGACRSPETQSEQLFREQWLMVCSPDFRERYRESLEAGNLHDLPAIQVKGYQDGWMEWLSYHGLSQTSPRVVLEISSSLHGLQAARQGVGVLLVRSLAAKELLESGALVPAIEGQMPSESGHYLITRLKRSGKVSWFCAWLHEQC
ncbi:LysR substrate-binding domain-containing protein [Halomonas sp. NCCP-2165]|nr:LysR substrate-binding domain-containing protein [Halomonas sp. NCCP-2165]GKW48204.1 transcriptional regulator [Halomonas sp. NCCP-2165]